MNYLHNDGLMSNLICAAKDQPKAQIIRPINLKTQKKQQKYSRKLRQQRIKNRNQSSFASLSQKHIENFQPILKTQQIIKKQNKEENFLSNEKIQKKGDKINFINQSRKRKNDTNYLSSHKNSPNKLIVPINIKIPSEITPKKQDISKNIDITPLSQFNLHPSLFSSLQRNNILKLTQIQSQCYKQLFALKDCIVKANTGSGKTLAYLIPLINQMIVSKKYCSRDVGTTILIICPNRELCTQGEKQALRCLKRCPFIVPGCLMGGQQINHQKNRLRKGINILFSTPGRLIYHLKNTKAFILKNLQTVVFEEADRTLDMGFQPSINEILQQLQNRNPISHLHKVLVSAHFNEKVNSLIENLQMNQAFYIGFGSNNSQEKQINNSDKLQQMYVLISEQEKNPLLLAYLSLLRNSKILIFVSTIDQVNYLDMLLNNLYYRDSNGIITDSKVERRNIYKLHGDLDQKLRSNTYFDFKKQKEAILISTEVASRGLDFPDLTHIILYDPPPTITDYGNRVGRSGRFNTTGISLIILHYQQSEYIEKLKYYNSNIKPINRDLIFDGYSKIIKEMNIGENSLYYLEGIIRGLVKDDDQKYQVARTAYTSMLRAQLCLQSRYARLPDKEVFMVKKLNLKLLARSFGLNSVKLTNKKSSASRETNYHTLRKRRKVQDLKTLEVSEYL